MRSHLFGRHRFDRHRFDRQRSGAAASTLALAALVAGVLSPASTATADVTPYATDYEAAFLAQYAKIKDPASGYFRQIGNLLVPYHGRITQNWTPFNAAWKSLETFAIPPAADQPTNSAYIAGKPATYAAEYATLAQYPSTLDSSVPAPTFTYHRFWAQAEIATAFATHDELFGS